MFFQSKEGEFFQSWGTDHAELEDLRKAVKKLKNEKAALDHDLDTLIKDKAQLVNQARQKELENRELSNQNEVLGELVAEHEGEVTDSFSSFKVPIPMFGNNFQVKREFIFSTKVHNYPQ